MEDDLLVEDLLKGRKSSFDRYDATDWSVTGALSKKAPANRSQPIDFPDFTTGKWKTRPQLKILSV